jgi:hypothetical protein
VFFQRGGLAGRAFAYDFSMRRLFLCLLLCLMPLRLLAGAWMPMPVSASNHLAVLSTADSVQHAEVHEAHDCHEGMAEPLTETHASLSLHNAADQPSDCHDGHCQLCGVCHQGLSLMSWPLVLPVFQAHPLPISTSWMHLARMSAPLTKPPIS